MKKNGEKFEEDEELPPLKLHPTFKFVLKGKDLKEFEDAMNSGILKFKFIRFAPLEEGDFQKAQKKLKSGLDLEMYPMVCDVQVDLSAAQVPGSKHFLGRGSVKQDNPDERIEQLEEGQEPKPGCKQYDFSNSYFKIEFKSEQNLTPEIGAIMPNVVEIAPEVKGVEPPITNKQSYADDFKFQLQKSLYMIRNDYGRNHYNSGLSRKEELTKLNIFNKQAELEHIKNLKAKYISKFVCSDKYQALRAGLRDSILKLVHDKFEKDMSPVAEELESEANKLVSEIHIFINKELKYFSSNMMQEVEEAEEEESHFVDLIETYRLAKDSNDGFYNEFIAREGEPAYIKNLKLCREYESLNMRGIADSRFKDVLRMEYDNHSVWYEYCKFKLRELDFVAAEEALWTALQFNPDSSDYKLLSCCFYIRRGRTKEALEVLENLLEEDKLNVIYNCFIALLYNYYLDRPKLCIKYFNVAQRVTMRNKGMLPPKKDKPDYGTPKDNIELSKDQQDQVWLKVIALFSNHSFIDLTVQGIHMLHDRDTREVNLIFASTEFLKNDFAECDKYLDRILAKGSDDGEILLQKALNSYMCERFYEAEEFIFRALKVDSSQTDFATLLRLGYMYLRRESVVDAKIILSKACASNPRSCLAWLGLGEACIKLELFLEAEKALKMANILDPINADIWGWSILLSLKNQRVDEALDLLERYYKMEIEDLIILNEIGNHLMNLRRFDEALRCFEAINKNYPKYGKLFINKSLEIGQVYWMIAELKYDKKDYNEAIKFSELALEAIEGTINRMRISEMLEQAKKLRDGIEPEDGPPYNDYDSEYE